MPMFHVSRFVFVASDGKFLVRGHVDGVCLHCVSTVQLHGAQSLEDASEIVKHDVIRQALEHKRKLPVGVDPIHDAEPWDYARNDIDDGKSYSKENGNQENSKAWRSSHELEDVEAVAFPDDVE